MAEYDTLNADQQDFRNYWKLSQTIGKLLGNYWETIANYHKLSDRVLGPITIQYSSAIGTISQVS